MKILGAIFGVLLLLLLIVGFSGCSTYNGLVSSSQAVDSAWAQVQTVYQRRADLIPNLEQTVAGAANFEKSTLTDVVNARAKATSVTISPDKAPTDPAQLQQFEQAQGELSKSLGRLLVTVERYPELKSSQNFLAFQAQLDSLGTQTTLLVDTYDIARGIQTAVEVAGPRLGAIRIDSGDLGVMARHAREQLDRLGATGTRIVVSGDLDEFSIAALAAAPVDAYGAGTAVVTGSGAPTAGLVYKLVEVEGRPVAKRSEDKAGRGGRKTALRSHKPSGTAVEEIVLTGPAPTPADGERLLQRPLLRGGEPVPGLPTLDESRELLRAAMVTLPWDGLKLSRGEPAIPTRAVLSRARSDLRPA